MTYHPIELADDAGYAGWYSHGDGTVAGYKLFDGSFLPRELCPTCAGRPVHRHRGGVAAGGGDHVSDHA
jgi:hypothetical protein